MNTHISKSSDLSQGSQRRSYKIGPSGQIALGILFTLVIAGIGTELARIPGLNRIGALACSILIAVAYRQVAGYPNLLRTGIQFSGKRLLRFAIILYGLKLNVDVILHQGLGLLVRDAATIAFALIVMRIIGRFMKADTGLSTLLGVGTGICGASAIAAVSPILGAKEEDTAIGAGIIALMGTVFAIAYTILRPLLPLTPTAYGIWSGVSIHEVAQVALAAAPAGSGPLAIALLAKLGRVFLLIPLSFILIGWRKYRGHTENQAKIEFPWFLVGFIVMSLVGTYLIPAHSILASNTVAGVNQFSSFILTAAMVGLGLNVSLKDLRSRAIRPLIAMTITSVLLSGLTLVSLL